MQLQFSLENRAWRNEFVSPKCNAFYSIKILTPLYFKKEIFHHEVLIEKNVMKWKLWGIIQEHSI